MSMLPPGLLHLVIYNPTLKPSHIPSNDHEDAEELAHILFYTSKQRAVSRDQMLRQVGLAKALVNFSSMFSTQIGCDTVHSQTRRMVMVSPEPDYWIHACLELARTPRQIDKEVEKGKGKRHHPETVYDYNDGALHDSALRILLLRGYESFKISHGSFTTIMASRGKEALELQLERFFTVWAWSLDLESPIAFSDCLGTSVHPLSNQLLPSIDALEIYNNIPLVLAPPFVISSPSIKPPYPPSLPPHLLSLTPLPQPRTPQLSVYDKTLKNLPYSGNSNATSSGSSSDDNGDASIKGSGSGTMSFLKMPAMNMKMDIHKWRWLNFGTGGNSQRKNSAGPNVSKDLPADVEAMNEDAEGSVKDTQAESETSLNRTKVEHDTVNVNVDPKALEDALYSERKSVTSGSEASRTPHPTLPHSIDFQEHAKTDHVKNSADPDDSTINSDNLTAAREEHADHLAESLSRVSTLIAPDASTPVFPSIGCKDHAMKVSEAYPMQPAFSITPSSPASNNKSLQEDKTPELQLPVSFSDIFVHFQIGDSLNTRRKRVRYLKQQDLLFALIPLSEDEDDSLGDEELRNFAQKAVDLLRSLKEAIAIEEMRIEEFLSTTPIKNVFHKSEFIIATKNDTTYTTTSFHSSSGHFHEGQCILDADHEILEVFSRGQNPQDWHLVKRGLGIDNNKSQVEGSIYMKIGRKEASLTDVDNELASVVRQFTNAGIFMN